MRASLRLLNLVEELAAENRQRREEVPRSWDEINRLKGEQGQPNFKPNQKPAGATPTNQSSERERRQSKARHQTSKEVEPDQNGIGKKC